MQDAMENKLHSSEWRVVAPKAKTKKLNDMSVYLMHWSQKKY